MAGLSDIADRAKRIAEAPQEHSEDDALAVIVALADACVEMQAAIEQLRANGRPHKRR